MAHQEAEILAAGFHLSSQPWKSFSRPGTVATRPATVGRQRSNGKAEQLQVPLWQGSARLVYNTGAPVTLAV